MELSNIPVGTGLPTAAESQELAGKVERLAQSFAAVVTNHGRELTEARAAYEDEAKRGLVPGAGDARSQTMSRGQIQTLMDGARHMADERLKSLRAELLDKSAPHRDDMIGQMQQATERMALVERAYPSPVAMLATSGLGSAERSRYAEQLRGAGPAQVATVAAQAIMRGDRVLAAAVLDRLDQLPNKARPFSAQELADKMVGDDHRELMGRVKQARLSLDRARAADRELQLGANNSLSKISRGLRAKELTEVGS